jgi:CheY-like chemotaxis protein
MCDEKGGRPKRVLVVDDEPVVFRFLQHFRDEFDFRDLEFVYAASATAAISLVNESCFDAALLDMRLTDFSGARLGELLRGADPNIPIAYLTNLDTEEARRQAVSVRAFFWLKDDFFGKPELPADEGMHKLLTLVREMVMLNPCVGEGGRRYDNWGHERELPRTPIEIPPVLRALAAHQTRPG